MNASDWTRLVADERGGVIALVAVAMPILILFAAFVLDVGNWFVHKRDLQLQADAAVLAGGGRFTVPCLNDVIEGEARDYSGDATAAYNTEKPANPMRTHVLVNSQRYSHDGGANYSDGGRPCDTKFLDIKITEEDIPLFFNLIPGMDGVLPAITSHARVEIRGLTRVAGALPVGVPDIDPTVGRVDFVDEATGVVLGSAPLAKTGASDSLVMWDNEAAPVTLPVLSSRIGVRVALGGGSSTTCGDKFVSCYDLDSTNGIVHIRGWDPTGVAIQPNPPLARDVALFGSCSDPYFSAPDAGCTIGVSAVVDFGPEGPALVGGKVTAVVAGVEKPLTYEPTSGRWVSTIADEFAIPANAGPVDVELKWAETTGSVLIGGKLQGCTVTGGNKCKGTFGVVHRTFTATEARSGPIRVAQVWEGGSSLANSFQIGTTHDLVVKIGVAGKLENATSVDSPLVALRVSGSQNQSVDCDPGLPNLRDEIEQGCTPAYQINTGTNCPATAPELWGGPQPWSCVAIQTGGAVGQVSQGLNARVHGGTSTCTNPSNWSSFPDLPAGDPRIVPVFLTPFGSFTGSGNDIVPVTGFGTFYVTGWDGDPCPDSDPVPDKGYVVGHFIKHIFALNNGGASEELCDFTSFGSCVAVLTQ